MTAFSHCRRQRGLFQDHILISNLKETEGLEKLLEFAEAVFAQENPGIAALTASTI